jgi:hypothetical protein
MSRAIRIDPRVRSNSAIYLSATYAVTRNSRVALGVYDGTSVEDVTEVCLSSGSLAATRPVIKVVLSWAMFALGMLVGLFALATFGTLWLPLGDDHTGWWEWSEFAGLGLLAVSFLGGSLIALRNPRRGSFVFLTFLPVADFYLIYGDLGLYVDHFPMLTLLGFTIVSIVPLFALVLRFRNRKQAGTVFAGGMLIAIVVFGYSRWTSELLPRLVGYSVPFLVFGIFWLGVHEFQWPLLLRPRPESRRRRVVRAAITCFIFLCALIPLAAVRAAYLSRVGGPDCHKRPPTDRALSADHAVFTARTLYVGFSLSTRMQMQYVPEGLRHSPVGEWALGVVQERFWGMPSGWQHLVVLTGDVYWKDTTYFISGFRERSVLDTILPVVRGDFACGRSQPAQSAVVDLHLLHQPRLTGAAIIGYVRQPGGFGDILGPPRKPSYLSGARIDVTGPGGTTTVTTDASGVYELDGLPAGDYEVRLQVPEGQVVGGFRIDGSRSIRKFHLKSNELAESSFALSFNPRDGAPAN